ncbi:DUF4809 family protein, partial [Vagococcus fluvialis]
LHQVYDISDDYDVYKKEGNEVAVIPEYDKLIFKKGNLKQKVANYYKEPSELFSVANNLLTQYFDLESINFTLENDL